MQAWETSWRETGEIEVGEEVTTIDDINNVVTIPVAPHTNSNDEHRNNRTINAVNASNKQPN